MKNKLIILVGFFLITLATKAQLQKVIVETYYVSDSLDATDTIDGADRALPIGSTTYRVYIDLKKGYKLKKIFGSATHPMVVQSSDVFFNNIDRPTEYFGYLIKKNYFSGNPTLMLDSWLTLGLATTTQFGILKTQDPDGSIVSTSWQGTGGVMGGIIRNNDPSAGIPLTQEDGLSVPTTTMTTQWSNYGFQNASQTDTTIFGYDNTDTSFISTNAFLQQTNGVTGLIPDSNQILIAQLTTKGNLSFSFNISILDSANHEIVYVAPNGSTPHSGSDTLLSPMLSYPLACGCTDPRYLEYDPNKACLDSTACHTLKVYGCTDTMACNYNPSANVFLSNFCCYPGYCNDRDLALVCPNLSPYRLKQQNIADDIYPNPVDNTINLQLNSSVSDSPISYIIYDATGKIIRQENLGILPSETLITADVGNLASGLYLFRISAGGLSSTKKFTKN